MGVPEDRRELAERQVPGTDLLEEAGPKGPAPMRGRMGLTTPTVIPSSFCASATGSFRSESFDTTTATSQSRLKASRRR